MNEQGTIDAVRKERLLACSPARAFQAFTEEMAAWWPLATHSVGRDDAVDVTVDGRVGGHITESIRDGSTSVWGTITTWEPPERFVCTWHPGTDPAQASTVEVTFEADGDGTRMTLVHTGWERRADGATMRDNYDSGWDVVLAGLPGHASDGR